MGFFIFLMVSLKHKGLYFLNLAILSSQQGIKSGPLTVKAWNPNLWTAREIPKVFNLLKKNIYVWLHSVLVVALGIFNLCYSM